MSLTPEELKKKLAEIRSDDAKEAAAKPNSPIDSKSASMAFRATIEMVSAVVVSVFLGYLLDQWLGSKPWFMIIMLFIGFIAGFLNVYRAATGQDLKVGLNNKSKTEQELKDEQNDEQK